MIGNYDLVLSSYPVDVCGNTVVDPGEVCDDGNTNPNDGCSATCAIEAWTTGTPNQIYGQVVPAGNVDAYPITVAATSYLFAETFSPTEGVCNVDTVLELYGANGTTFLGEDDEDGVDSCSRITGGDAFARLAPGNYFLEVHDWLDNSEIPSYLLSMRLVAVDVCGNGVLEGALGEACDDGNLLANDGCSATCTLENAPVPEAEPNNTTATANSSTLNGVGLRTVTGAITPVADVDYFSFVAGAGQSLTAQTYGAAGNLANCSFDSEIFLFDSAGVELTSDDEGGANSCSLISGFGLPAAGTYYIRVERWNNSATIAGYFMDIRLQ